MPGVSEQQVPTGQSPPARAGRGRQTALDMVRSLALVLVAVGALVLLVPRPSEPIRQPVDVASAVAQAQDAGLPVVEPRVPESWYPNAARYARSGPAGTATFHVGYVTPDERFAGVQVARQPGPEWLREVTARGREVGTQDVAGQAWDELLSDDGTRRSLVLQDGEVTTVVTGTATLDDLAGLAQASQG